MNQPIESDGIFLSVIQIALFMLILGIIGVHTFLGFSTINFEKWFSISD